MFEAVRKNKRISQVILAIIIVPFAFFGMDAYFSGSPGSAEVATVGGSKISVMEFDQALRQQQDRIRDTTGGQIDRAQFESEAFRRAVLESLINQRILLLHALENRMVVTDQQVQEVIVSLPAFQDEGRFSLNRYEALLRAQGMSPAMFERQLAQDLRTQQIAQAVGESAFVGLASARRLLLAQLEEREIREVDFPAVRYVDEVAITDEAVRAYYDANPSRFERPPRLRAEYVVLDHEALLARIEVSDADVEQFYASNPDRFGQPEEHRARHILIQAGPDASAAEVEAARNKAQQLLDTLRDQPERFEELARAESEDPGSAESGGDLGFFGPGAMVQAFEDAVFSLSEGAISDVVRSDFGFHIIQLTGVKPSTVLPLEQVREEIVGELGRQEVARQFALLAEQFANIVYEQPDSLEPAAETLGLEIRTTDWISRENGRVGRFNDERLVSALFSEDVRVNGENIEAIEVERGTLVSARVIEYEEAQRLAFEEVRSAIEEQLREEEGVRIARERGEAVLARLVAGETPEVQWSAVRAVRREEPTLPPAALRAVFGASVRDLPAHVGAVAPDGTYTIYRVESVNRPEPGENDPRLQMLADEYARLVADKDFAAYLSSLRERYKVEIRAAALRGGPER